MLPLTAVCVCVCGPGRVCSTEGIRGLYLQRGRKRERGGEKENKREA